MIKIMTLAAALLGATPGLLMGSKLNDTQVSEKSGFFLRSLQICHQDEWRNITISLEYETDPSEASVEMQEVRGHVRKFLEEYPNPKDFWEVMNTRLVSSLIKQFPTINNLHSKLSLAADRTLSFPRESLVQYERSSNVLKESFSFTKLKYCICSESFRSLDLHVAFELKENPTPEEYPDYQWVDRAMEEFFVDHPISYSKWSQLKPKLEAFLLERFPSLTEIDIQVKAS